MKYFTIAIMLTVGTAFAANNLPDKHDENLVPQSMEERQNEPINSKDSVDLNTVPADEEKRQEEEFYDSNSDVIDEDAIDDEIND